MKYYAIIDGEQKGPFELSELPEVGIRPSTYVWCKEMTDWEKAEDVAEICRMYRNRLYDIMHPTISPPENSSQPRDSQIQYSDAFPTRFEILSKGEAKIPTLEELENMQDYSQEPKVSLLGAILAIIAFPPAGLAALYYCLKTKRDWKELKKINEPQSVADESDQRKKTLQKNRRKELHEQARKAKMLIWMSFFLGILFYATILSH